MRKKQESQLEGAETRMLMSFLAVTRKDRIRNKHITGTLKVDTFGQKVRQSRDGTVM